MKNLIFWGIYMFAAPIMFLLNTSFVFDHERLRNAVNDMYQKGLDTICVEFRNCIYNEYDPQGKAAMKVISDEARKLGIQFVMIMPMLGPNLVKQYPEARQIWAVEHQGQVIGKKFAIPVKNLENGLSTTSPSFRGIAKAFHVIRDNKTIIRIEDIRSSYKGWIIKLQSGG